MIRPRRKPRRGRVIDRDYLAWMATQPCCVTGEWPATTHHVRSFGSPKDDRRTIRLVARLHMLVAEVPGQPCIERSKAQFEKRYGIDIETEIAESRARYLTEVMAA